MPSPHRIQSQQPSPLSLSLFPSQHSTSLFRFKMLGSRFCVRTVSGVGSAAADHTNAASTARSVPSSVAVDFSPLHLSPLRSRRRRSILISCDSSRRRSSSGDSHDNNNDYLEASLLLSSLICTSNFIRSSISFWRFFLIEKLFEL